MSEATKDMDGLYYPYIHIRDEGWLKTTLLYFPHILRMVPPDFETGDSAFVQSLASTPGTRGEPLLGSYKLGGSVTDQAVDRLTERLIHDIRTTPGFAKRFSKEATQKGYGKDSKFVIHRSKAPQTFWSELSKLNLIWQPSEIPDDPYYSKMKLVSHNPAYEWAALHPIIGEAFMATVATAAARDGGLEVVTESSYVHAIASCRDEELVYQTLIRGATRRAQGAADPIMTHRLAHLVIASGFDVSRTTAKDLAEMSKNKEALFDFRRYLAERIGEIPEMGSDIKRENRLKAAAEEALDEWRKSIPNMSRFARRFFGIGLLDKSEKAMADLAKALIPGSLTTVATAAGAAVAAPAVGAAALIASPLVIAAAPGLAVALAIYGVKTAHGLRQEEMTSPLRYLSLLKQQGAALLIAAPPKAGVV